MMSENLKYIKHVINESETTFFATINLTGTPECRALANNFNMGALDDKLDLYFTTSTKDPKMEQIKKNNRASVYYYLVENMQNLTLFGTAEIINDKNLKDKLWRDDFVQYYPKGREDETYGIIKFVPDSYKYYTIDGEEYNRLEGKI